MIHNAEIHITRADPARHEGLEGFVYAITWGNKRIDYWEVHRSRAEAAVGAASHLDELEDSLLRRRGAYNEAG